MRYLLDTSIWIEVLRGNPTVLRHFTAAPPGDCVISAVSAYELFTGSHKCSDPARERAKIDRLLGTVPVLGFDLSAAEHAAAIRAELESRGLPIGPYDLLLAGQARSLGLPLVTGNVGEFSRIPGLTVENWSATRP